MEDPKAPPAPPIPKPSAGNTISNLHILRTQDAYVAIEHPQDWSEEEVLAAVQVRMMDLGQSVDFWSSQSRTRVKGVFLDEFDPDNKHRPPFELTADDLSNEEA